MPTKTTGSEIKKFYSDPAFWPDNAWHEDELLLVDGAELSPDSDISSIPDAALVTVEGGIVLGLPGDEPSFETHFRRWRKAQNTVSLLVECDKGSLDAVRAAIRAAGGRLP